MSGLFYKFCEDIIEQTKDLKNKKDGYKAITTRFFQWKKMFVLSKNTFLTEPEIMGMIGEILFLRGPLADEIGLSEALKSWSGQELTHKDFSCSDKWYEVKTISRGNTTVRISSLEQLDSDKNGELIVYSLEKMSPAYNGISLNKTFIRKTNGLPYTEPHHLIPMMAQKDFDVSLDVENNIVSLCSNCHNLLHYGKDNEIVLKRLYDARRDVLRQAGIEISFEDLMRYYK